MATKKLISKVAGFCCLMIVMASFLTCNTGKRILNGDVDFSINQPVAWGLEIEDKYIKKNHLPGASKYGDFAHINLVFINIPPSEEGNHYTLIGGGMGNNGLHGPESTHFKGRGFNKISLLMEPSMIPVIDVGYNDDYTRMVQEGKLVFDVYYQPDSGNKVLESQYDNGPEVMLSMIRTGTIDHVLFAANNKQFWAISGVGKGNSAEIIIDMSQAEYTWFMEL